VVRGGVFLDGTELLEHLFVDVEPPRRVEDERGEATLGRFVAGRAADIDGPLRLLAEHGDAQILAETSELLHRRRTVDVGGGQYRMLPLLLEMPRELGRRCGLPRALQSHQHDDGRGMRGHGQPVPRAPEQLDQLVVHHLDHVLARRERREHVLPDGLDADPLDEALDHFEIDVGFEESYPDLSQGLLDILLRQPAEATEPVEDSRETRGKTVEHGVPLK
jgi:hypothetical protein